MNNSFFLSLLLLLSGITFQGCGKCTTRNILNNDTIVHVKELDRKWNKKEVFVTIGNDTSAYSFIFSSIDKKRVFLKIAHNIYEKSFYNYITKDTDTSAYTKEPCRKARYSLRSYRQMLNELSLCLSEASKTYNIDSLATIMTMCMSFQEISVQVSNKFLKKNVPFPYRDKLTSLLNETSPPNDLNKILKRYNIEIKNILCCDKVFSITDKEILKKYLHEDLKSDSIVDFSIRISLKSIKHR